MIRWLRPEKTIRVQCFFVLFCLYLMSLFCSDSAIADQKQIIAGVLENWPPQYQINPETKKPVGFAVDIMEAVGRLSNIEIKYEVFREWPKLNKALREKRIDVIPNMGIIPEREKFFNYTNPIETTTIRFFIRKTSTNIKTTDDIKGRFVSVVDTNKGRFLMEERGWKNLKIYQSFDEALMSLISGVSDTFVYPDPPFRNILRQYGLSERVEVLGKPLLEVKRAIAVHKDDSALIKRLDVAVSKLMNSAEYNTIYTRWYGEPALFWSVKKMAIFMGGAILFVGFALLIWRFNSVTRLNHKLMLQTQKRHQVEETLRENEERFRALATNTPDHIIMHDNNLRYTWVLNPQLGLTVQDMVGKTDFDILPEDDAVTLTQMKKEVLESGNPQFVRVPLVSLAGDVEHFEGSFIPKHDKDGNIDGLIGYFRNVTNRMKSELALRESEERFRRALENIPDVVVIYGSDLKIRYTNAATSRITGRPVSDFIGKREEEIWPPEVYETYLPTLKQALSTKVVQSLETQLAFPDGTVSYLIITCVPLLDEKGNVREILGITHDLTEHKNIEAQRQKTEALNRQAQKMESIGNLAGGIAHDFNNILSSIIGFTELAMDGVKKDSELDDNLLEVYNAAKRATALVKQILVFSRQTDEEIKPVQIGPIVKEVLQFIRASIPTSIEIKQNIENNSVVKANATQVHQIFMNLCTNAAHAMDENGGTLEIALKDVVVEKSQAYSSHDLKAGTYLEATVTDTGHGIAPEIIGTIFEPYFTTKELGEGTGMGLAMVHGIVEGYGGKIGVESLLGKGTTFSIYLPIIKKHVGNHIDEPDALPSGTERILFIDDEAPIAKIGSRILQQIGYTVTTRTSSLEALALFRAKPDDFDLVITDMTMPKMTGDKLAQALMEINPEIPVIICTGYSKKISEEKADLLGIKAFAYKPIVRSDLAKTVRKVLDETKG
jgi:PAS domain S-box-containing protein